MANNTPTCDAFKRRALPHAFRIDPLKPALIAAFTTAALAGVPQASAYTIQSINSPGSAVRMSGNGAVVGNYISSCTTINTQFDHAKVCFMSPWFFDGKSLVKLDNAFPSSSNYSSGAAINNTLMVVGAGGSSTGGGSWLYSAGAVTYTGTLQGAPCIGTTLSAINNLGVAAGSTCFGRSVTFQNGSLALVNFNDPYLSSPTTQAVAIDISDGGLIAGWYKASDSTEHGFVVDPNSTAATNVAFIPNLSGATSCRPVRISQAKTGPIWVAGNCSGRPYIYNVSTSSLTELTSPGSTSLSVASVNSQGVAVGAAYSPNGYTAVLWPAGSTSSTVPVDLNANQAFAPIGALNVRAIDLNEAGTVLTGYNDAKGHFYTFLLRP